MDPVQNPFDIRQSPNWANYMKSIGWEVEKIGISFAFIKKIPLLNHSIIKIQHPHQNLNLNLLDLLAKKHKSLAIIVEPHNAFFKESDFLKNGYQKSSWLYAHTLASKINLQKTNKQLFTNFSENARRNIKKAQKNNIKIQIIKTPTIKDLEIFLALFKNLAKNKNFFIPSDSEMQKKFINFKQNSYFAFASIDNQIIAALWLGHYKKVLTYMHTGIKDSGYSSFANYLLVWQSLLFGKKQGFEVFDFEALYDDRFKQRKAWQNFTDFKKRFHGQLIYYPPPQIKFYNILFKYLYLWGNLFSK